MFHKEGSKSSDSKFTAIYKQQTSEQQQQQQKNVC